MTLLYRPVEIQKTNNTDKYKTKPDLEKKDLL